MRIYRELANWYPLITAPPDYAEEAAHIAAAIGVVCDGPAETLLELGAGAGANVSHLKARFRCTLTDLSPDMLELSRAINPECEHLIGDMRSLRLNRLFDAVLIHDAIGYMTTEADLRSAIETASCHLRPGGAALFIPDDIRDRPQSRMDDGGHDAPDGRSLRYLMWTPEPAPDATAIETHFALLISEPGRPVRCEHDIHTTGRFPRAFWHRLIYESGLDLIDLNIPDPHEGGHTVFAARKRRP